MTSKPDTRTDVERLTDLATVNRRLAVDYRACRDFVMAAECEERARRYEDEIAKIRQAGNDNASRS